MDILKNNVKILFSGVLMGITFDTFLITYFQLWLIYFVCKYISALFKSICQCLIQLFSVFTDSFVILVFVLLQFLGFTLFAYQISILLTTLQSPNSAFSISSKFLFIFQSFLRNLLCSFIFEYSLCCTISFAINKIFY